MIIGLTALLSARWSRRLSAHFLWKGARGVFGYVTPDKGEMKVREYECYRPYTAGCACS